MKYFELKDLVQVDSHFQNSVNIQLDLSKHKKVSNYIPTRSSLKILDRYVNNIIKNSEEKSTILIGPYGKGKSHLLLVLLSIISMNYDDESIVTINKIIDKISLIDPNLAKQIIYLRSKNKRFLPVVLSNAQEDLNQSFLIALNESLKKDGLESIAPDTYYSEAINIIAKWEKEYQETYKLLNEKLEKEDINIKIFLERLRSFDKKSYNLFCEIYPDLTSGSKFNPLINMDIMTLYQSVNNILCNKYEYSGIFIVFDEFSKYIEGHKSQTISKEMKVIQDMCELANASKENQLHIIFVAHKSIKEYGNVLSHDMINAFTGVKGRLSEVLFITSAKNNYELIENAIHKDKDNFEKFCKENLENIIDKYYDLEIFHSLFEKKDFERIIVKGCFPLNPLAAYFLLNISEKVAQNERTLFTFISKNEKNSLARYISNHKVNEDYLIGVDYIYDYFKVIFKQDVTNVLIHNEWLKAEYALKQTESINEQKVIKAISLLNMLNNQEQLNASQKNLSLCVNLYSGEFSDAIEQLLDKHIIIFRKKFGAYAFKNNVGVDIEREIKRIKNTYCTRINICSVLSEFSELDYILPKMYNQENKITRYFEYKFMEYEDFKELPRIDYLFNEKFSDGKIIALIPTSTIDSTIVREKIKSFEDLRIVVIQPKENFTIENQLKQLVAIKYLQNDENFIENNRVIKEELSLYEDDLLFEISNKIEEMYFPEHHKCIVYSDNCEYENLSNIKFNRLLSDALEMYYDMTPIINNEMINRNAITPQIKKARNQIIQNLLDNEEFDSYLTGSGPESTIFRATLCPNGILNHNIEFEIGVKNILREITIFLENCEGDRQSFEVLYSILCGKHFGMRKGVIPIYLAYKLSILEDTPVIYLKNKEVELTADVFNNINDNPKDYYLYIEKGSQQKEDYIRQLELIFKDFQLKSNRKGNRLNNIVDSINRWYRSLPQYTVIFQRYYGPLLKENFIDELIGFRKIFQNRELNPREIIFEKIPRLFDLNYDYLNYGKSIEMIKDYLDDHIIFIKRNAINQTKFIFHREISDDFSQCLKDWYSQQSNSAKTFLHSTKVSCFMNYIQVLNTHNEEEIINRLSKIILDIYIEDWDDNTFEQYIRKLSDIINEVENIRDDNNNSSEQNMIVFTNSKGIKVEKYYEVDESDSNSYFFKNLLEEVIDEVGDTLEINQKVSVIVRILERLLNN